MALLFLHRRGVVVPPSAKRALYASFVLSYALTFLVLHGETGGRAYLRDGNLAGSVYSFARLGIPGDWRNGLLALLGAGYLTATFGSIYLLARDARLRDLGPTLLLMLMQASWFSAPAIYEAVTGRPVDLLSAGLLFIWVAIGHSVQYLWITTYYATRRSGGEGRAPEGRLAFLTKSILAGALIWTLPALAFAPGLLGKVPYDLGLHLLVAAAVNIHHFVLDGAIWKLKDSRVARVLIDTRQVAETGPPGISAAAGRRRRRAAIWALGVVCFGIGLVGFWEYEFGYRQALSRRDFARAETAADRLIRMGRDNPDFHVLRGNKLLARGDVVGAGAAYQQSLDLHTTADGWLGLGITHERMGDREAARDAYVAALELDPNSAKSLYQLGMILLESGAADRALPLLERARALVPGDPALERAIQRARKRQRGAPPRARGSAGSPRL